MSSRPSTAKLTPDRRRPRIQPTRNNRFPIILLLGIVLAGLGLTGCIGLTGAQSPTPGSKATTTQASSNELPGRQPLQAQVDSTAPVVTTQPVSQVVTAGQSAAFSVAV